jgi:hypothetical protein
MLSSNIGYLVCGKRLVAARKMFQVAWVTLIPPLSLFPDLSPCPFPPPRKKSFDDIVTAWTAPQDSGHGQFLRGGNVLDVEDNAFTNQASGKRRAGGSDD